MSITLNLTGGMSLGKISECHLYMESVTRGHLTGCAAAGFIARVVEFFIHIIKCQHKMGTPVVISYKDTTTMQKRPS